ncbi:NAD-dependent succinate-semialdehyde dehydrogenase [Pseudoalteromonas sp. MMG010]|uniref:NAD-dependent succinate-semialdehyde dehydrogenase n=1 Tax=Pseudoalteromonas sp. MMG010 TaxID=2822685 RepID=UPI001B3A71FD|nr:NAD-dependent succinate-semialdehyde dehydrogenase [Pseudoalteromonas sp. MMG010]MBQ4833184.1 NAD-dependent succinate-semialdehyde dehydrogenase [Pseudoalteromonas sp. MMG010]
MENYSYFSLNDNKLIQTDSFIDGGWYESKTHFNVNNPVTGQTIAKVSNGSKREAECAVQAAKRAFKSWSKMPAHERGKIMRKWFDLIMQHQDDLSRILTIEQGKPLAEAKGEIAYGASFIEWFSEEAKRVYGDVISAQSQNQRIIVIKQAVGVVAAITPWNFPCAMIARKAAAALAAGCTFVVRPAEKTPLTALAMAELAQRAGVPKGVFNVVVGEDANAIGQVFTTHPDVAKFTFTGSTAVGKLLISQCASTVKKVSMELGGNAPFIVFKDADIDAAVKGAIISKYRNAGQTCVCTNRILVDESILKEFTDKFVEAVSKLKLGDGLSDNTDIGPLISTKAVQGIDDLVQASVAQGAKLILGGKVSQLGSQFYQPTVLTNVTPQMSVAKHEIFGPVTPIMSFKTEDEAISLGNDTQYGLAAYFYSRDIGVIWRVAEGLDFGMIGINEGIISNAVAPFGGVKQSGNGREGSKYGLDDYLEIKYLCMGDIL